jgi:hypothetical protein
MKKLFFLVVLAFVSSATLQAQTTDQATGQIANATKNLTKENKDIKDGWNKGGTLNLTINEAGRNDAWIKGGEKQSLGLRGLVDYNFNFKKGKLTWLNSLRARYGLLQATSTNDKIVKNDDFFNYNTTVGSQISKNWSVAGFLSLETQFEGWFMTPGSVKLGPGLLYRPNKHFNMLVSPAMMDITTKLAPSLKNVTKFGVDSGKVAAVGVGAFAQISMDYDLAKNINYKSVTTLYSNYTNKPGNIMYDMTNLFTLTVNKFIGATISINSRYNDNEIGKLQLQHAIGVGFNYKL